MSLRPVKRLVKAKPTLEGAGVHLRRAFGFGNTSISILSLLDDFRNDVPEDYLRAFPGIPTAASRRSHTFSLERWSTATVWETGVLSPLATSSG